MHSEGASNVNCSAVVFKGYIATIRISFERYSSPQSITQPRYPLKSRTNENYCVQTLDTDSVSSCHVDSVETVSSRRSKPVV